MRKFSDQDEHRIFELDRIRTRLRSGLLTAEHAAEAEKALGAPPLRAHIGVRLGLFVLGAIVVGAAAGLANLVIGSDRAGWAITLAVIGGAAYIAAETLIPAYRLFRFGVEESFALGAAVCLALSSTEMTSGSLFNNASMTLFGAVGALACGWLYVRFRYLYAGLLSLAFAAAAGFCFFRYDTTARVTLACLYASTFAASYLYDPPAFERRRWRILQAASFAAVYFSLHLRLERLFEGGGSAGSGLFYWGTFAAIWLLPAVALAVGARGRHRPLLDAGIALLLVTLCSVKPYFGRERNVWDPAVLGLLLLAAAWSLERWLRVERDGFTSKKTLVPKRPQLAEAAIAAALAGGAAPRPEGPTEKGFTGGGGASGGAGASGTL